MSSSFEALVSVRFLAFVTSSIFSILTPVIAHRFSFFFCFGHLCWMDCFNSDSVSRALVKWDILKSFLFEVRGQFINWKFSDCCLGC